MSNDEHTANSRQQIHLFERFFSKCISMCEYVLSYSGLYSVICILHTHDTWQKKKRVNVAIKFFRAAPPTNLRPRFDFIIWFWGCNRLVIHWKQSKMRNEKKKKILWIWETWRKIIYSHYKLLWALGHRVVLCGSCSMIEHTVCIKWRQWPFRWR